MGKTKPNFEAFLRKTFQAPLDSIAGFLLILGITANLITLFGLVGNIVAACLIARGQLLAGGLVAAFMAPWMPWMERWHAKRAWLASLALFSIRSLIVMMK